MKGAEPKAESATRRTRVVAALLIVALAAGPATTHLYWMLGGTWGLQRSVDGRIEQSTTTGIQVVAAVVVLLLVARGARLHGAGRVLAATARVRPP